MPHCPYCGTKVKEDELFCIKCGKALPKDIKSRIGPQKNVNKYWLIPVGVMLLTTIAIGTYYLFLQSHTTQAKTLYKQGEEHILDGDYDTAQEAFENALDYKGSFSQATIALSFLKKASQVDAKVEEALQLSDKKSFQEALRLIQEAEQDISDFNGTGVTELINKIMQTRHEIQISQLHDIMEGSPSIDDLKILLWEAESINNEEAAKIAENIRSKIVDFTFTRASEQLNHNHFSDALILVEDGLKYAPNSEKLQSLKTTIEKEKVAFETTQQERIEQAINTATEEQQLNETNALEVTSLQVETDDENNIVVKGEVESVATVPINSILVEYTILTKEETELLSNEVYVFPDKLYPNESGKFEFTHYDIDNDGNDYRVEVDKMKWYVE
ncbi:zinc ribbon domain-containing protein [Oceanobacillus halotolerans]|uniref:zinc ribbon domain-containing protein n=1 Tax=Oceanobacillus halotolerans TaxID=2663380 RepID=UPI0013DD68D8|nr:zinc ribbon domain-containing protein [Oceanobacillus halotolerans]